MPDSSDFTLVDVGSFDAFYRVAEPQVRRALVATLGVTVGREASSAAMAYGFEHWERVRQLERPLGYLYRVGRNSARHRRRPLALVETAPVEDPRFEPELWEAVRLLPESQRVAVLLVTAWRYTLQEAADVLGVSVSTLRNHHERGLQRLRREIGATDE